MSVTSLHLHQTSILGDLPAVMLNPVCGGKNADGQNAGGKNADGQNASGQNAALDYTGLLC